MKGKTGESMTDYWVSISATAVGTAPSAGGVGDAVARLLSSLGWTSAPATFRVGQPIVESYERVALEGEVTAVIEWDAVDADSWNGGVADIKLSDAELMSIQSDQALCRLHALRQVVRDDPQSLRWHDTKVAWEDTERVVTKDSMFWRSYVRDDGGVVETCLIDLSDLMKRLSRAEPMALEVFSDGESDDDVLAIYEQTLSAVEADREVAGPGM